MLASQINLLGPGKKMCWKSIAGILPRMSGQETALSAEEIIISHAKRAIGGGQADFFRASSRLMRFRLENCAATDFREKTVSHQTATAKMRT